MAKAMAPGAEGKAARTRAAPPQAKGAPPRDDFFGCPLCSSWYGRISLYLAVGFFVERIALWSRFTDMPYECEHPVTRVNNSGVKVIVAGYAKSGTRTLSRALWQLGFEHSYHSEEFNHFVWAPWTQTAWNHTVKGRFSAIPSPLDMIVYQLDRLVLHWTEPARLAYMVSRCRVDTIAFDGIERVMWPLYEVSPDAKVLLLNWRTFEEWRQSLKVFGPLLLLQLLVSGWLCSSLTVLPWGVFFKYLDPLLFNRRLELQMKSGGPPFCQEHSAWFSLWHDQAQVQRISTRWFAGLANHPATAEDYYQLFTDVKRKVPAERLMEVDAQTHTYEDICRFLELKDCRRSGKFEKAVNLFNFEVDFPGAHLKKLPVIVTLHVVNFCILQQLRRVACRTCRGRRPGPRPRRPALARGAAPKARPVREAKRVASPGPRKAD